jgi:hypothetical protein
MTFMKNINSSVQFFTRVDSNSKLSLYILEYVVYSTKFAKQ